MNIHDVYKIFQDQFRPARMQEFAGQFDVSNRNRIIDLGGSQTNWTYIPQKPKVLIANPAFDEGTDGNLTYRKLDATALPHKDRSFDIAFSNSVIEHVGDWENQKAFARETRRVAGSYYVQTPNRWFFIEPHFIAPFIHFLPRTMYRKLIPFFSIWYWVTWPSKKNVDQIFEEIRLLTRAEMHELFPDAEIREEKFLFFTKSFIAVRNET